MENIFLDDENKGNRIDAGDQANDQQSRNRRRRRRRPRRPEQGASQHQDIIEAQREHHRQQMRQEGQPQPDRQNQRTRQRQQPQQPRNQRKQLTEVEQEMLRARHGDASPPPVERLDRRQSPGNPRHGQHQQGRPGDAPRNEGNQNQPSGRRRGVRRPQREEEPQSRIEPARHGQGRVRQRQNPQNQQRFDNVPAPSPTGFRTAMNTGVSALPPAGPDVLRVIPLGGVGEVGKNMTAVECGNDVVLLDCGAKFPEEDQRGIDLIVPDVSFIMERLKRFHGILITHGHEDHIGGLPHIIPMLREMGPVPVYGTPLALGFIERKLLEAHLEKYVDLIPVSSGKSVKLGNMTAEFIHVTHSIPDACAIALHTNVGTIVDTGDFKFDPTPVMGGPTDERLLKRIGDRGVLALFSDTVRVETEGSTPSEKVVQDKMDQVMATAQGQFIIATFASNVSRIHMALRAAAKNGRKVAVAGRSMEQNARVALELGYLDPPEGLLVPLDELLKLPKEKRVIVSTGSQGEAAAALARIAAGEHPKIRVSRGDLIFVSATPIPGNEDTVSHTIDNLFRLGCDVVYSAVDRGVHVSGHAGRDELQKMINLLRPKYAVPIHGEYRHMALYRELCTQTNIKRDHVLLPEIGGVIEFTKTTAHQRGRVPAGNILIDRLGDRGDGQVVMRTRENLLDDGFVLVTLVLDRQSGDLIAGPQLVASGLKPELNNGALHEAEQELRRLFERRKKGAPQYGYVVQRAKETVGKALYRRSRSRPLILPVVTEL